MRDVNLEGWEPTPHHTYFMHVQNSVEVDAVGLSLVQIGDGSEPCTGLDSHKNDNYDGHVLVIAGQPKMGVEVQYFRDKQFITETVTDKNGRHSVRLEPGCYQYRFLVMGETKEYEILVKPGLRVLWQDVSPDGLELDAKERQIKFITEELVCNWDNSDGEGFRWLDVSEIIAKIAGILSAKGAVLRQASFAQFCRPEMLKNLQTRGVYAVETEWRDIHFAAAFRNLVALGESKLVRLRRHDEAKLHMERNTQFVTPTKIASPPGTQNYLALARAAAIYHASTLSGTISSGTAIYDPNLDGSARGGGGIFNQAPNLPSAFGGPSARVLDQRWNPRA
jgi:hypothetical protein